MVKPWYCSRVVSSAPLTHYDRWQWWVREMVTMIFPFNAGQDSLARFLILLGQVICTKPILAANCKLFRVQTNKYVKYFVQFSLFYNHCEVSVRTTEFKLFSSNFFSGASAYRYETCYIFDTNDKNRWKYLRRKPLLAPCHGTSFVISLQSRIKDRALWLAEENKWHLHMSKKTFHQRAFRYIFRSVTGPLSVDRTVSRTKKQVRIRKPNTGPFSLRTTPCMRVHLHALL